MHKNPIKQNIEKTAAKTHAILNPCNWRIRIRSTSSAWGIAVSAEDAKRMKLDSEPERGKVWIDWDELEQERVALFA